MSCANPDRNRLALKALIADGLTFADCVAAFGTDDEAKGDEGAYLRAAKTRYHRDGAIEVDDQAVVSASADNGAYVSAWVWVYDRDIWEGPVDSDGEPCRAINHYRCDHCEVEWTSQWSCMCDEDCPECSRTITPYDADELDLEGNNQPNQLQE